MFLIAATGGISFSNIYASLAAVSLVFGIAVVLGAALHIGNRSSVKAQLENLRGEVGDLSRQRDEAKRDVAELRRSNDELRGQLAAIRVFATGKTEYDEQTKVLQQILISLAHIEECFKDGGRFGP